MNNYDDMDLEEQEDYIKDKYLIFTIDREEYALGVESVIEIIAMQGITPLPEFPDYIKGLINLRGKIVPVLDIRLRFKKDFREYDAKTCILVAQVEEIMVGLIVDRVSDVMDIPQDVITEPPSFNKEFSNRYIKAIGNTPEGIKLIIDCNYILSYEEIEGLTQIIL
jgi:purine-binding chemotaxis protein CheW